MNENESDAFIPLPFDAVAYTVGLQVEHTPIFDASSIRSWGGVERENPINEINTDLTFWGLVAAAGRETGLTESCFRPGF